MMERMGLTRLARRDWAGLAIVALATSGLIAYRAVYIEPRAWGTICAAAAGAPLACGPRSALVWLQREYLWGGMALALGLVAFLWRGPFVVAVAAVVMGIAAVENYNATWGMVGAALGAWAWLRVRPPGVPARAANR
jgi:hypothetical protein